MSTITAATDEEILTKLKRICERLGQPSHAALPLGQPHQQSCVFGCALNGAVESITVFENEERNCDPTSPYDAVEFFTTSEEAALVLAEELDGDLPDGYTVVVSGGTPEMRWMKEYDAGAKPWLVADGPVRFKKTWDTYADLEPLGPAS